MKVFIFILAKTTVVESVYVIMRQLKIAADLCTYWHTKKSK
jgi:hypothetical protein